MPRGRPRWSVRPATRQLDVASPRTTAVAAGRGPESEMQTHSTDEQGKPAPVDPHRLVAGLPGSGISSANSGGSPRDVIAPASRAGWSSSLSRSMETTDTIGWRTGDRYSWTGPDRAPGVEARSADVGARNSQPRAGRSTWTARPIASKGRRAARPSWPTQRDSFTRSNGEVFSTHSASSQTMQPLDEHQGFQVAWTDTVEARLALDRIRRFGNGFRVDAACWLNVVVTARFCSSLAAHTTREPLKSL